MPMFSEVYEASDADNLEEEARLKQAEEILRDAKFAIETYLNKRLTMPVALRYLSYIAAIGLLGLHDGKVTNNYGGFSLPAKPDGTCPGKAVYSNETGKCYVTYPSPADGVRSWLELLSTFGKMRSYLEQGDINRLADEIVIRKLAPIDMLLTKASWLETKQMLKSSAGLAASALSGRLADTSGVWIENEYEPDYEGLESEGHTECADRSKPVNGRCPEDAGLPLSGKEGFQADAGAEPTAEKPSGLTTAQKVAIAAGAVALAGAVYWYVGRPRKAPSIK